MANVEIDGVNSKVYTDQVDPKTGTTLTLGTSGDTVNLGTGVTAGTGLGGTALTGSTDNQVTTVTGANAIQGETNFIYNGTIVGVGADGANADLGTGLHIKTADSGGAAHANADELVIEGSGNSGMTIASGSGNNGSIFFSDSGDSNKGYIEYKHGTDALTIGTNAANAMNINTDGLITQPKQVCFLAKKNASAANETGDATQYNISYFTGEVFDQNADFNATTGIFTAPITARYLLSMIVRLNGITSGMNDNQIKLITSNTEYSMLGVASSSSISFAGDCNFNFSTIVDMDAADTAYIQVDFRGGSKVVDIDANTWYSGYLLC